MGIRPSLRNLRISFISEDFPTGSVPNGVGELDVSWGEILWAALTVGRPSLYATFDHGSSSFYEAIFRISQIRMALQQQSKRGNRLYRTDAFKALDMTEKGSVNYALGMVFCKLFASRLLQTPWLLHLDVFKDQISAKILKGRSRPDLVGKVRTGVDWHAFEAKGRGSPPNDEAIAKAKRQAERLVSVGGTDCRLHVGAFTFFKNDTLQFRWRDPEAKGEPIVLPEPTDAWRMYYEPVVDLLLQAGGEPVTVSALTTINGLGIEIGLHPKIAPLLFNREWGRAHDLARELSDTLIGEGYEADGIAIRADDSWSERFSRLPG